MDLSIIIVSYNTKKLLQQCLDSIINHQSLIINYEIFVVDNASTDGSVEMVKKMINDQRSMINRKKAKQSSIINHRAVAVPPAKPLSAFVATSAKEAVMHGRAAMARRRQSLVIKLIANKKNLGFAKANNQGIKKARGKYILFLNPDTVVNKETLPSLIAYMNGHPKVGVVTCRVELPDGRLDDACHRGFPSPWNAFCHFSGLGKIFPKTKIFSGYSLGYLLRNTVHEIDSCCGAFFLTRRAVLDKVGFFDEDFFWYGEDLDLCFRIKEAAYKVIFYPGVKIVHYKGASSGLKKSSQKVATATDETRKRAVFNSVRAMQIFYEKHYQEKYPKLVTWLVNLGMNLLLKVRLMKVG